MRGAYYNEFDPGAAAWLRELIARGLLPAGDVDERDIRDVAGDDLRGYRQCHFFAGIGGWPYALRLAGWPDDRPVWTGSCPCQPFSVAGPGRGYADERHLAPAFLGLVAECDPPVVLGEQVASKAGRDWLADLRLTLEALGYAVGAADLCAPGVGAPHIRQRLFWGAVGLADGLDARLEGHAGHGDGGGQPGRLDARPDGPAAAQGAPRWLADTAGGRGGDERQQRGGQHGLEPGDDGTGLGAGGAERGAQVSSPCRVADSALDGRGQERADAGGRDAGDRAQGLAAGSTGDGGDLRPGAAHGGWGAPDWLFCRDGKWRPAQSSLLGLADGLPDELVRCGALVPASSPLTQRAPGIDRNDPRARRVLRLRGYGNAIVPQLAAEFVLSFQEAIDPARAAA